MKVSTAEAMEYFKPYLKLDWQIRLEQPHQSKKEPKGSFCFGVDKQADAEPRRFAEQICKRLR